MSQPAQTQKVGAAYRISRALILFIYAFAIACIVILSIAFFLQLFNANEKAPFVDWVYRASGRIMQPFRGIFPSATGEQGSVFDVSMLFAMFMYALLAFGMQGLITWIDRKIAAARYERMSLAASPPTGQNVVTIPSATTSAPPAPVAAPPSASRSPDPPYGP